MPSKQSCQMGAAAACRAAGFSWEVAIKRPASLKICSTSSASSRWEQGDANEWAKDQLKPPKGKNHDGKLEEKVWTGWVLYNDQLYKDAADPPSAPAKTREKDEFSSAAHSKGVVAWNNDHICWLIHSVPCWPEKDGFGGQGLKSKSGAMPGSGDSEVLSGKVVRDEDDPRYDSSIGVVNGQSFVKLQMPFDTVSAQPPTPVRARAVRAPACPCPGPYTCTCQYQVQWTCPLENQSLPFTPSKIQSAVISCFFFAGNSGKHHAAAARHGLPCLRQGGKGAGVHL